MGEEGWTVTRSPQIPIQLVYCVDDWLRAANITPAPSGIGYYNEATFVRALREGKVGARPLHASMPWYVYGKMTDDDLKSIFAYLQTVKPVRHQLDNAEPPTFCRLCKQKHGMGATN